MGPTVHWPAGAGFDVTVQAQSGMSSFNGLSDTAGDPMAVPDRHC